MLPANWSQCQHSSSSRYHVRVNDMVLRRAASRLSAISGTDLLRGERILIVGDPDSFADRGSFSRILYR